MYFLFFLNVLKQTRSPQSTSAHCTTQVDKNRHNRTFYNGVGGRTTGLQTLS